MNFLQRLNPFYLRKELQRTKLELAIAHNNYERVLSDSEILQQTYDDNPELIKCGGVEQYLAKEHFEGDYKPKYTKRELKLLLDLHLLRQDNETLRENVEWSNVHKSDELRAKNTELTQELHAFIAADDSLRKEIETLTTTAENLNDLLEQRTTELKQVKADLEIETLTTTAENLNDLLEQRTTELKQVKADLEKTKKQLAYSKKVNEAWFNTVLGYGVYDNILLNKAFWGKQLELVELSQEDSDERNS